MDQNPNLSLSSGAILKEENRVKDMMDELDKEILEVEEIPDQKKKEPKTKKEKLKQKAEKKKKKEDKQKKKYKKKKEKK